jgi:hypothetical protein
MLYFEESFFGLNAEEMRNLQFVCFLGNFAIFLKIFQKKRKKTKIFDFFLQNEE